jgi:alpha-L-rhamnosidase
MKSGCPFCAEMSKNIISNGEKEIIIILENSNISFVKEYSFNNLLSENGYAETAYKVAVQDTYPSWGWWMVNGATTLLENWDLQATRDISDNHMMFGEIGAWFYKGLGGIFPDPAQPGFQNILLRPHFIKGLKRFEARHRSPYGEIVSRWEWKGKCVHYEVTVPANSTATLTLPDKAENVRVVELAAGRYEFIVK